MKHLPIFLIIIVSCLFGCSKSEQTNSCDLEDEAFEGFYNTFPKGFEIFDRGDNICFINYRNKIHGYDVRIGVRQFIYRDSTLIGNAEIAFLRNDTLFLSLPNPFFRIDGLTSKNITNHEIVELDYTFPTINKLKPIEFSQFNKLPFFFLDVNFDGNDELIMNYAGQGLLGREKEQMLMMSRFFKLYMKLNSHGVSLSQIGMIYLNFCQKTNKKSGLIRPIDSNGLIRLLSKTNMREWAC